LIKLNLINFSWNWWYKSYQSYRFNWLCYKYRFTCNLFAVWRVLYPSLRESFGIPMLEAMSCNVPVTPILHQCQKFLSAAHIINFNWRNYPRLIEILWTQRIENHFDKGLERSKQFSWNNMARDYLKLYELIDFEHSKKIDYGCKINNQWYPS
jgi:hypothetical protein